MKRVLKEFSPRLHPHRWLGVNCAIIASSAILLIGRLVTLDRRDDDEEKTEVEWSYLLYNFLVCGVWLVEVFFNVLDWKGYFDEGGGAGEESLLQPIEKAERTRRAAIALYVEMGLAVYFFIDSTSIVYDLSRKEIHDFAGGMAFDACLNMLAYSFMVYQQYVDWRESRQDESGQAEPTNSGAFSEGIV